MDRTLIMSNPMAFCVFQEIHLRKRYISDDDIALLLSQLNNELKRSSDVLPLVPQLTESDLNSGSGEIIDQLSQLGKSFLEADEKYKRYGYDKTAGYGVPHLDTLGGYEVHRFKRSVDDADVRTKRDVSADENKEDDIDAKEDLDTLGGFNVHSFKRPFDSLGGYNVHSGFKRPFDSLGGMNVHSGFKRPTF